ncbi:MAG: hypothetical protein AAF224_05655 [Pseudomonadota bacterium]
MSLLAWFAVLVAFFLTGPLTGPASAAAIEISVAPLRTVLTEKADTARVRVSNPSNRILELRVGWVDLTALPEGYAPATPEMRPGLSAAPYLTVSPAFMRLEPSASADVVITFDAARLTDSAGALAGLTPNARHIERRSHLLFSTEAARTPLRKAGGGLEADIGLGVSIPVHVRADKRRGSDDRAAGRARSKAQIGATELARDEDGALRVDTSIERDGPYSVYGRLSAIFETPDGTTEILGRQENVTVHIENERRLFRVPLGREELPAGVLVLKYEGRGEYSGRLFAEKRFAISAAE